MAEGKMSPIDKTVLLIKDTIRGKESNISIQNV